jgi:hypothetical protein
LLLNFVDLKRFITLDAIGSGVGNATRQPEHVLPNYDLVFAKGRAALEALSVGAAVVLLDAAGVGPMVTTANMENLRSLNFGIRTLQHPIDADVIGRRISRYNAADAMQVSAWIRKTAAMDGAVDHLIALYNEVLDEHRQDPGNDTAAEFQAASNYLRQWVPKSMVCEPNTKHFGSNTTRFDANGTHFGPSGIICKRCSRPYTTPPRCACATI